MSVFIIQFADTNHLTLHVHDRVLFGDTWQGFVHDNFEFERAGHPDIECRGVITIVIGIGRGGAGIGFVRTAGFVRSSFLGTARRLRLG